MTPTGQNVVPLFQPNALLLRELRRSSSDKFEVYGQIGRGGATEITLVCYKAASQSGFAPNLKLVGTENYAKPKILIYGNDESPVLCRFVRAVNLDDEFHLVFEIDPSNGLNLRSASDNKLRQVWRVEVETQGDRHMVRNSDFRPGFDLRKTTSSGG